MTNSNDKKKYDIVFQKLLQFQVDDAEILAVQEISEVIDGADDLLEELQALADINDNQNEFYSST